MGNGVAEKKRRLNPNLCKNLELVSTLGDLSKGQTQGGGLGINLAGKILAFRNPAKIFPAKKVPIFFFRAFGAMNVKIPNLFYLL